MIKNDRQCGILRGRVERLQRLQDELLERLEDQTADRARVELELKAVRAEIRRMEAELDEYLALKEGRAPIGTPGVLEDLPRLLIRARIAAGLTQAELAQRLDLKEQQIQRYEATDYESASLARLIEIADALRLRLSPGIDGQALEPTPATLLRRLERAGLDPKFVEKRFGGVEEAEPSSVLATVARLAHVYRRTPEEILQGDAVSTATAHPPVAYKRPKRASERRAAALAGYAAYLTQLVSSATSPGPRELPTDPVELHARMAGSEGPVSWADALEEFWAAGVPVLPLRERGGFHAAYWRHVGRNIIVVNSVQRQESRWLFYLLHEAGHVIEEAAEPALVEDDPGRETGLAEDRERRANEFATAALLGGESEQLFRRTLDKSRGNLALMQRAVRYVARHHNVDVGALAFNVALRLAEQGRDWWGAATNLQRDEGDPWQAARDALIERLDWSELEPLDADLLARALDTFPRTGTEA